MLADRVNGYIWFTQKYIYSGPGSLPESIGLISFWKIVWFFKFNRTKIKYIFSFILLSKGYLIAEALYHRVLSTFFDWAGKNFTLTLLSGHQAVCAYFPSPTKEQLQQLKWATFGSGSNSGFWLGFFPKFTVETAAQGDCETFWWRGARVMRSLDS